MKNETDCEIFCLSFFSISDTYINIPRDKRPNITTKDALSLLKISYILQIWHPSWTNAQYNKRRFIKPSTFSWKSLLPPINPDEAVLTRVRIVHTNALVP